MNMKIFEIVITGVLTVVFASLLSGIFLVFAWNWSMPIVFGLPEITFFQAIALSFVANILIKPTISK